MQVRFQHIRINRWALCIVLLSAAGLVAFLKRSAFLQDAADLWVVSDPITPADAVVVLGGGTEVRPFVAANFYTKGLVHKVLVSDVWQPPSVRIGALPGTSDDVLVLEKLGVPHTAIELFGKENKNSREEAIGLRDWSEQHKVHVFIVPVEAFFARRARWIFQREFYGTGIRIEVPSFDGPTYSREGWWHTEDGVISFQNEIMKYLYYRLKY
jgi:uncharacterized SAM-binding protein YcdF (DUF218 family)